MPPTAPTPFVHVNAYGPASPANFFQSRAVQTVVPLQVWPIEVQPVAETASAFRFETWATRMVEPLTSAPVGFASDSDAVVDSRVRAVRVITVIAGSITYGSSSSRSSSVSSSRWPLTGQRSPAGVTSSPEASRICTGAISNVPPVGWSTSATRPSTLKLGSSFVPSCQRQVRSPCRRSTVRNSSAFVPSRTSVRAPYEVRRVTPCSVRVHSAPRARPIGSRATLPKSASATRARSRIRKRSPVGSVRCSGVVRAGAPSACSRNSTCGAGSRSMAAPNSAAAIATSAASASSSTCPAFAGRFEGRSSSLVATCEVRSFVRAREGRCCAHSENRRAEAPT